MKTRSERIAAALAALDGLSSDKVAEAAGQCVSARAVRYLRSGRDMKREPNEATVVALETAVRGLNEDVAA